MYCGKLNFDLMHWDKVLCKNELWCSALGQGNVGNSFWCCAVGQGIVRHWTLTWWSGTRHCWKLNFDKVQWDTVFWEIELWYDAVGQGIVGNWASIWYSRKWYCGKMHFDMVQWDKLLWEINFDMIQWDKVLWEKWTLKRYCGARNCRKLNLNVVLWDKIIWEKWTVVQCVVAGMLERKERRYI